MPKMIQKGSTFHKDMFKHYAKLYQVEDMIKEAQEELAEEMMEQILEECEQQTEDVCLQVSEAVGHRIADKMRD